MYADYRLHLQPNEKTKSIKRNCPRYRQFSKMSIVTLAGLGSVFTNTLDKAITLNDRSVVELVMMSSVQSDIIDIVEGVNDQLSYNIGAQIDFSTGGTITVPPGEYDLLAFRRILEYLLNAKVPVIRQGATWHVSVSRESDVISWTLRLETSFILTDVTYDITSPSVTTTPGVVTRDASAASWTGYAISSAAFTRGRGRYTCVLTETTAGNVDQVAFGLTNSFETDPLMSIVFGPSDWILYGFEIAAGVSGDTAQAFIINDRVKTAIGLDVWAPANDDVIEVSRAGGVLTLRAYRDEFSIFSLPFSYANDSRYDVLFPATALYTPSSTITGLQYFPDGDSTTSSLGDHVGMHAPDMKKPLDGHAVRAPPDSDAYTLHNLGARSDLKYITTLNPLTLAPVLGFSGIVQSPLTQTYSFVSDSAALAGIFDQGLHVNLRDLPIDSRSGVTGQVTQTIATVPRLIAAGGGQLRYVPQYQVPVAIKYQNETNIQSFTVQITDIDGKPLPLRGRTVVCIRISD